MIRYPLRLLTAATLLAGCLLTPHERLLAADSFEANVMSFNIRYGTARDGENSWPKRKELVFDVIRREKPDVIGLQEALHFQINEILAAVPGYTSFGVGRDDGKTKGEYAAILYRESRWRRAAGATFWLSDTPDVVASKTWGNGITRICTWARLVDKKSGLPLTVYNLHLDHRSQPSRERSVELLAKTLTGNGDLAPFVVLGDFNAAEDNSAIRYLKGSVPRASGGDGPTASSPRLVDTFRVLHADAKSAGTFNGWRDRDSRGKIDYVLTPPWIRVLDARIVRDRKDGRYPSDHFPVTARLVVPRVRES